MKIFENNNNHLSLLVVSLLSASSRIFETISMILPIKAVFVFMKPDILPDDWYELGLTLIDFMFFIAALVMFSLFLGRVLHVVARQKARELHVDDDDGELDKKGLITTKITAALVVMTVFLGIVGYVHIWALLLIVTLVLTSLIPPPFSRGKGIQKFYSLLGITEDNTRVRFVSQLLFLVYFMCLLIFAIQQDIKVGVSLLLVMLVGRRFFGELTRFRRALLQKKKVNTSGWDDD